MAYTKRLSDYSIRGGSGGYTPTRSQFFHDAQGNLMGHLGQFGYSGLVSGPDDGIPIGRHQTKADKLLSNIYGRMEKGRKEREVTQGAEHVAKVQILGQQYADLAKALGPAALEDETLKSLGKKLNEAITQWYKSGGMGYEAEALTPGGAGLKVSPLGKGQEPVAPEFQPKAKAPPKPKAAAPAKPRPTRIDGTFNGRKGFVFKGKNGKLFFYDTATRQQIPVTPETLDSNFVSESDLQAQREARARSIQENIIP